MKTHFLLYRLLLFLTVCLPSATLLADDGTAINRPYAPDGIPFTIANTPWKADLQGNHRAVIQVDKAKRNAVRVILPWRRPDLRVDTKRIKIVDATTGDNVQNIKAYSLTPEKGELAFMPKTVPGKYYVYYLPYRYRKEANDARYGKPWNDYLPPVDNADPAWLAKLPQTSSKLPVATVLRFEARSAFDFFTEMGTIATQRETQKLLNAHPENPILFQEDRIYAIRMQKQIPVRWTHTGLNKAFEGSAQRNEYYVWQVGVWAPRQNVDKVRLSFSDLKDTQTGAIIPKDQITCFNQEGTNWDGSHLSFDINVPKGTIQALWCGVQIPENARQGSYHGTVSVSAAGMKTRELPVTIHVSDQLLADKGDGDLWRLARLRWLNSTIGLDNHPVPPFKALSVDRNIITATDKNVTIGANGLPEKIEINGKQILARPLSFLVKTAQGDYIFQAANRSISQKADGLVTWQADSKKGDLAFSCTAQMEYDGYIHYDIKVSADHPTEVEDIQLIANYTPYVSEYMMGTGLKGGYRPEQFTWDWKGPYDSYWIGNTLAGLHMEYRGGSYHGPLLNDYKPESPQAWANGGKGTIVVEGKKGSAATVLTHTGKMTINPEGRTFEFALLITPAKPVDTRKQFSQRYFHSLEKDFDHAAEEGANIMNIHQSRDLNPFINYPFVVRDSLKMFINHEHQEGRKVKLYYTIRELSNYCSEIFALKSLNHEIFVKGVGYGEPWLCEHLIDDYKPAWYTPVSGERQDASLVITGFSRWINYYLEGYRWMLENYHIDGLYMDDVAFDRDVMKRMRKIMEKYRPGSLIDLHSNTGYSVGPMNQYTGFFPYVDRLWFGESFQYDKMTPDEWFVTFSGIPFGVMSEMLQGGGNRWLGMVYGAANRHSWTSVSPAPVWKLWKDFGIIDAKMIGYWDEHCPITTNQDMVKATAYVKPGQVLVSIGNFDTKDHDVQLNINWKSLGFGPQDAVIEAPEVKDFQEATTWKAGQSISVKAKRGWLLIIRKKGA